MEKFSQYRDRGSGIAPFFPIPTQPSGLYLPFHLFLFCCRLPILVAAALAYLCVLQWLPVSSLGKKACLWSILGTPGIWWYDLKIDGVKKGSLAKHHQTRFPQPGTIIASTLTSPIDALYLAAIFDPIFTASYPSTRLIRRVSLLQALMLTFSPPQPKPPRDADLTTLQALLQRHPKRTIVVFPECTTTNGRAILPLSPSLLTTPPKTSIFPTSLRYSPADVTTPLPGHYLTFFWSLMSKPTHCIRIRIAESVYNNAQSPQHSPTVSSFSPRSPLTPGPWSPSSSSYGDQNSMSSANGKESETESDTETLLEFEEGQVISDLEKRVLDRIGEALARMGRVKRVGLGVKEKSDFVKAWVRQGQRQKER